MKIGTRSVLHGVHCFFLHPFFVAWAWKRLYGFPWSIQLWTAFFVHDLGYIGKPNMDGEEGETHPILGAKIMEKLYGPEWGEFTLLHSRHYARLRGKNFSQLCVADKLASILYPRWLYVRLAQSTGEMQEYRRPTRGREANAWIISIRDVQSDEEWFDCLKAYLGDWVNQNKHNGIGLPQSEAYSPAGSESNQ
jgi:hypothetical protein